MHTASQKKSNLRYTGGITPKRVTSGGIHRGLAHGQRRNVAALARAITLTGLGIEPRTSRTDVFYK